MYVMAIVCAAGLSTRMKQLLPKPFIELEGRPIISYPLEVLENSSAIEEIILVVPTPYIEYCKERFLTPYKKCRTILPGGTRRQDSVYNGLLGIQTQPDIVLIHDGARPFLTAQMIEESIDVCKEFAGAVVAIPVVDTIKSVRRGLIDETLDRTTLWITQTPQTFRFSLIMDAYTRAYQDNIEVTDDAALVERLGQSVAVVLGSPYNIKITTPQDLMLASGILKMRE